MLPTLTPPAPVDLFVGSFPLWALMTSTANNSANRAHFVAFQVNRPHTVSTAHFRVGTQSGNMDVGLYDDAGVRLGSTGAFSVPGTGTNSSQALTASVSLVPGRRYYTALVADNTTATFGVFSAGAAPDVPGYITRGTVNSAHPLPASVTLPTVNNGIIFGVWFS
jgi:hypothetical protein